MEIKDRISSFLKEIRPEFDFDRSADFIADGLLDSFDIISLTTIIEESFGIKIAALDIVPENYDSVEHIEELIRKSGGA